MTRRLFLIAFAATSFGLASCGPGDSRKPVFRVSGTVTDGSKPVANALVVLHPVGETGPDAVKPHGTTNADGAFTLTTYDGNDGAPAGEYRVTVTQFVTLRPDAGPEDQLKGKYATPEKSKLTATVDKAPTVLKPIEVRR